MSSFPGSLTHRDYDKQGFLEGQGPAPKREASAVHLPNRHTPFCLRNAIKTSSIPRKVVAEGPIRGNMACIRPSEEVGDPAPHQPPPLGLDNSNASLMTALWKQGPSGLDTHSSTGIRVQAPTHKWSHTHSHKQLTQLHNHRHARTPTFTHTVTRHAIRHT